MRVTKKTFGQLENGSAVYLYTLEHDTMRVALTNYGGIITSISVPDNSGEMGEVVLGFDQFEDYLKLHPYFGALIGPVANRISNATYWHDKKEYKLDANEGVNQIHGGTFGFDKVLWQESNLIENEEFLQVSMTYHRPDNLMGFPGNLDVVFTVTLYPSNRLDLNYLCKTDFPTPVNLTHHEYFNLNDGGFSNCLSHDVQINAEKYTPTKDNNCVTGQIINVESSAFDLREFTKVGEGIERLHGRVYPGYGYDHNFLLKNDSAIAASIRSSKTGRRLDVYTNKPCIQFYTGSHLDGSFGRNGSKFEAFHGICLETQSFPDAVNQPDFPNIVLKPNETYDYFTSFVFSTF